MRSIRLASLLLLLFVTLPLGGCRWQSVRVVIPDFASADVLGLRLWRESPTTGEFEPDGEFRFTGSGEAAGGVRNVFYTFVPRAGSFELPIGTTALLTGDLLLLELHYPTGAAPALYRISTWNEAGESALSTAALRL